MRFDTPLADRVTALLFFALGASMAIGGYQMDRLEIRQIHPASIPGLLPMVLGAALMLCAVLLAFEASKPSARAAQPDSVSWSDFLVVLGFCAVYAIGMVGRVPFGIATAIFVTVFVGWFTRLPASAPRRAKLVRAVLSLVFGCLVALAISLLFRYAFLVRLP
ncbi:tripartite tricarboxylate transporter TctB family protein [Oceanomicrobium pacificus]|uniref:DUF1468 domain-containing protein n=1 Tax=Oceanomicrobium pacificus TaxID=2692916 RepID=A0A6B0TTW1_9RHOB|nr:tripartite tricarboxylate transporter TctB family protein [Oceanomicrobium pacificus]MXU66219.1 hypothetical protein [Oceanomicrobium pacificus]